MSISIVNEYVKVIYMDVNTIMKKSRKPRGKHAKTHLCNYLVVPIVCSPCIGWSIASRIAICPFACLLSCISGKNACNEVATPSCILTKCTDNLIIGCYDGINEPTSSVLRRQNVQNNNDMKLEIYIMFTYLCDKLSEANIADVKTGKNYRAELIVSLMNSCLEDLNINKMFQPNLKLKDKSLLNDWKEFFFQELFTSAYKPANVIYSL